MTTTSPTPALLDDHLDLLVTAASSWHILGSRTAAAFAQRTVETHVLQATGTQAGRLLRAENVAAIGWLSEQGRTRLVDRAPLPAYTYRPVEDLVPVEVIKAAQAAHALCEASPTWSTSIAQRLVHAIVTAATHRLDGYADAPWRWSRPQLRAGHPVGVTTGPTDSPPQLPGLFWTTPSEVRPHWQDAPLIVLTPSAAAAVPADLPGRGGVFLLVVDETSDQVWDALTVLDMQALVLFWPICRPWLSAQLDDPGREYVTFRSHS